MFGRPENARGEFRAFLPPRLVAEIDWDALAPEKESLGSPDLRWRYCDLLFRARLANDEREAFLFLLHDHQSTVDARLPLRLFFYAARILERWEGDAKRRPDEPVPALLCVVLFQGPGEWTGPVELAELYDLEPDVLGELRPHLPNLRPMLDDLDARSDEELRKRGAPALGKLGWLLLKRARAGDGTEDLLRSWRDLFAELEATGSDRDLEAVALCTAIGGGVDAERLPALMAEIGGEKAREAAVTTAEPLEQRGELKGMRRLLLAQLRDKFAEEITSEVAARVDAAAHEDLERWGLRAVRAASLAEVFSTDA